MTALRGARVLFAEDNELNQIVASELLRQHGSLVDIANNGEEAVALVQQASYQLVLMDMQMPVLDGVEATRRIRGLPDMAALPIVAMTANAMDTHREECLPAGMNDFMTKPINPEALQVALLRWIDTSRIATLPRSDVDVDVVVDTNTDGDAIPATQSAPKMLEDIKGLATAEALKRLLDNRSLYERLLRRFCSEYRDFNLRLAKLKLSENITEAKFLVHTLKGLAATLGAKTVQREAAKLETLLRTAAAPADCDAARVSLSTALADLLEQLAVVLQLDDAGTATPAVPHPADQGEFHD